MSLKLGGTVPNFIQASTTGEVNVSTFKRFKAVSNLYLNLANFNVLNQMNVEE
jgi:hypothetical protein